MPHPLLRSIGVFGVHSFVVTYSPTSEKFDTNNSMQEIHFCDFFNISSQSKWYKFSIITILLSHLTFFVTPTLIQVLILLTAKVLGWPFDQLESVKWWVCHFTLYTLLLMIKPPFKWVYVWFFAYFVTIVQIHWCITLGCIMRTSCNPTSNWSTWTDTQVIFSLIIVLNLMSIDNDMMLALFACKSVGWGIAQIDEMCSEMSFLVIWVVLLAKHFPMSCTNWP